MFLRTIVLIISVFSCSLLYSQTADISKKPIYEKSFDVRDGLDIDLITSIQPDNLGWLWIGGLKSRKNRFKNENQTGVLYRFNGSLFQNIKLPVESEENYRQISLHPLSESSLLVAILYTDLVLLYKLDVNTLVFKRISLPKTTSPHLPVVQVFDFNNESILFIKNSSQCRIFSLKKNGDISFIGKLDFINEKVISIVQAIDSDNFFLVENQNMIKVNVVTGQYSMMSLSDIDAKFKGKDQNLVIKNICYEKGQYMYQFENIEDHFSYKQDEGTWSKHSNILNQIPVYADKDESGNAIVRKSTSEGANLDIVNTETMEISGKFQLESSSPYLISGKNFNKKVFLATRETLYQYVFTNSKIVTFLPDYSIRAILPFGVDEFLVGTESNGLYTVNVKDGKVKPYSLNWNGNRFSPLANRAFLPAGDSIWTNDNTGLVHFTQADATAIRYPFERLTCLVEDEKFIYGGTVQNYLLAFDKKLKEFIKLEQTDTLDFSDIDLVDSIIYGATNRGLYRYDGKTGSLHQLDDPDDHYLLSIDLHPKYGMLIGSRSGKLFRYDIEANEMEEIYHDKLKASIAGLLFDDKDNIWINTFAGVVKYNPETKEEIRFDESEGLSHFECNRHSAIKTDKGYFLIGTLNGLNFFHPDSLESFENTAKLELVAIEYFESDKKDIKIIHNSAQLSNTNKIVLPAENRNLKLDFTVLGNETNERINYKYSLDGKNWDFVPSDNRLELINLAPGSYDLEIEALNFDQERIGQPIKLEVVSKDFFYRNRWFIFLAISLISGIAIWLLVEAKKRSELQKKFSQRIISASENQKAEIARELHDSVGQKLVLLGQKANLGHDLESQTLISKTLEELRSISKGLHPSTMERLGATAAIQGLIDEVDENSDLFINAEISNIDSLVDRTTALHIYRIIQESLGNIIKHSGAQAAEVKVIPNHETIDVVISDNGIGFDYNEKIYKGMGMRTLVERATIINSKIAFTNKGRKGTLIKLSVPFTS